MKKASIVLFLAFGFLAMVVASWGGFSKVFLAAGTVHYGQSLDSAEPVAEPSVSYEYPQAQSEDFSEEFYTFR